MPTTQVQLHIRVPEEVRRTLKVVAAEQGKPLSQVVQEALLEWAGLQGSVRHHPARVQVVMPQDVRSVRLVEKAAKKAGLVLER